MNLAVWRGVRLAAEAECGENDKSLNGGLHWSVWLYCHKSEKGRLKTGFLGFQTTFLSCLYDFFLISLCEGYNPCFFQFPAKEKYYE
jgi:hypothetical protein